MQTFYRSDIIDSDDNALYCWSKNRIQNQNVVPYYEYYVCMNGTSSLRSHICRDSRCRHMWRCHDVDRWLVRTLCGSYTFTYLLETKPENVGSVAMSLESRSKRKLHLAYDHSFRFFSPVWSIILCLAPGGWSYVLQFKVYAATHRGACKTHTCWHESIQHRHTRSTQTCSRQVARVPRHVSKIRTRRILDEFSNEARTLVTFLYFYHEQTGKRGGEVVPLAPLQSHP